MIAVKYLAFFFDPSQNRENQLSAIQPLFSSPSAIKALLKTAKFENKSSFIYSGVEDNLEQLLKIVQRKDTTDWLDCDAEKIEQVLDEESQRLGLSKFKYEAGDEEQVLGDPPMPKELQVAVEAAAKKKLEFYPQDIPEKNHWLWDNVALNFKKAIKRCGKDKDKQEASLRILYQSSAQKLGLIPFSHTTVQKQHEERMSLCADIEAGEAKASSLIETWERHLKSDGNLKKSKAIKYLGSDYDEKASRYFIAHTVEWEMKSEWKILAEYLTRNHGITALAKDHLVMTINKLTKLEVIQDAVGKVSLYISHVLTPHQASIITGKYTKEDTIKVLHKMTNEWYKKGEFPNLKMMAIADDTSVPKSNDEDMQKGSAHPENWQTALQTGKSTEELRQDAIKLADILLNWQETVLMANEYFKALADNSDKYLHMFEPILIKGLSREKLENVAKISSKFAKLAHIV